MALTQKVGAFSMTILIEHPQHGRMHVYSEFELKRHIEMGWHVVAAKAEPKKRKAKK